MSKNTRLYLRISDELKEQLEQAAKANHLELSAYVRQVLSREMERINMDTTPEIELEPISGDIYQVGSELYQQFAGDTEPQELLEVHDGDVDSAVAELLTSQPDYPVYWREMNAEYQASEILTLYLKSSKTSP